MAGKQVGAARFVEQLFVSNKTLGISWLNGRFRAVVTHGPVLAASWTPPEAVADLPQFATTLIQAVRETGYQGRDVSLVLDNRNLVYHLQETPPGKPAILLRLIDRQVEQHPFFDEPAVWGHRELPPAKGKRRHLLTLVPRSVVEALQAACGAAQLELKSLFAPAAILERQLRGTATVQPTAVLLAANADGLLCLVSGDTGGQVFFARSVSMSGNLDGERVAQEINRTLLFTQQQFGVTINECRLLGDELRTVIGPGRLREGVAVVDAAGTFDPFHYAAEVTRLPVRSDANIVGRLAEQAPAARRGLALAAAVLLGASIVFATLVEFALAATAREHARLRLTQSADEAVQLKGVARQQEADRQRRFVQLLSPSNFPPVGPMLLRFLGAATPTNLTLTRAEIIQTNQMWRVRLEGVSGDSVAGVVPVLERFEAALTNPPFQMLISDSSTRRLFGSSPDGSVGLPLLPSGERTFFIEGRLR